MKKYDLSSINPVLLIIFAVLLGVALYSFIKIYSLSTKLALVTEKLDTHIASTTVQIQTLAQVTDQNFKNQQESISFIDKKIGTYREQVNNVSSTVSTLEKLSKTDPEILAKYSKVFFLSENYSPARLSPIPDLYKYTASKNITLHTDVVPRLQKMIDDARAQGINIFVSSGYRSFEEQKSLKSDYKVVYGSGANQFSADQGYSEHQLGTTVDLTTPELKGVIDGFEVTPAYKWMRNNAHRYGFVLSYPEGNKFYQFEPWHWRFVGTKLATDLWNEGKYFYDLDQRNIDNYLVSVF